MATHECCVSLGAGRLPLLFRFRDLPWKVPMVIAITKAVPIDASVCKP